MPSNSITKLYDRADSPLVHQLYLQGILMKMDGFFPVRSCKEKFSPDGFDRTKSLCPYLGVSCALLQ